MADAPGGAQLAVCGGLAAAPRREPAGTMVAGTGLMAYVRGEGECTLRRSARRGSARRLVAPCARSSGRAAPKRVEVVASVGAGLVVDPHQAWHAACSDQRSAQADSHARRERATEAGSNRTGSIDVTEFN
jgi:hypothetical protein